MEQEKYPTPEIGPEKEILKKEYPEIEEKPKKPWLKITLFSALGLVLVGEILFVGYRFRQRQIQLTPQPTVFPSPEESGDLTLKLGTGKIAYIKDGDVYLLNGNENKRLTVGLKTDKLHWSTDGKYLGWINRKEFYFKNPDNGYEWVEKRGASISLYDFQTNKIFEPISQKYQDEELRNSFKLSLFDFDFSPDTKQIVYVRNGVWVYDLQNDREIQIGENFLGKLDDEVDDVTYVGASWNPKDMSRILFDFAVWECGGIEVFDINTYKKETLDSPTCGQGFWSTDGESIIDYSSAGMLEGGLWITNSRNKKTIKIVGVDPAYPVSVTSAAVSKTNQIIAMIEPFGLESTNLPYKGENIYSVGLDGKITPLTKDNEFEKSTKGGLAWSPNGGKITYLLLIGEDKYNLQIMDVTGANETTLLTDISSYVWGPLNETVNWKTYISKYEYSIKYPPNFLVKTSDWREDSTQYRFDPDDEVIIRYTEPNQPPHGGFPYGISVSLNKPEDASDYNSGKKEAEKWLEKLKDDKLWGEMREEIIAGNKAIRLMNYFEGFNISVDVYHKGRKFMFGADIFAPEDNNYGYRSGGEYEKTFNLMLSTLHFLD